MLSVSIANQQEAMELDYARIKTVARAVLEGEGIKNSKITLAMMTDQAIHVLNKRYLDHDEPTDVITFPYSDAGASPLQGDLAISTETAMTAALERGHAAKDELLLYVIHGLLHLCGYDDLDEQDRLAMKKREAHYLQELGITLKH